MIIGELYAMTLESNRNIGGARMVRHAIETMELPFGEALTTDRISSIHDCILSFDRKSANANEGSSRSDPVAEGLQFLHVSSR